MKKQLWKILILSLVLLALCFSLAACIDIGSGKDHTEHVFDNDCDTRCNECEYTREVFHKWYSECDSECDVCGEKRTPAEHTYDNGCDADCNECGLKRGVTHIYDNACDTKCNLCGLERSVGEHVYDNACDVDCNECEAIRTVGDHVYDNACDASCNVCSALRVASGHVYGDVTVTVEPTHSECGKGSVVCEVCGATDEVVIPEQSGLSGGAVAAISVGSTVTVGAGSFSLLWFVIRKKKWIDLVTAFRA